MVHADAGDGEAAAGDNRDLRYTEIGGIFPIGRRFELQQRHVGGGAMRRYRLHVERGVHGDFSDIPQLRLFVCGIFDDLVDRAGLHAMRRRQHQPGAIKAPVQKLPREPTMVTTERPTPSADGTPPPTIASAGSERSRGETAIIRRRIFIGARLVKISMTRKLTSLCGF